MAAVAGRRASGKPDGIRRRLRAPRQCRTDSILWSCPGQGGRELALFNRDAERPGGSRALPGAQLAQGTWGGGEAIVALSGRASRGFGVDYRLTAGARVGLPGCSMLTYAPRSARDAVVCLAPYRRRGSSLWRRRIEGRHAYGLAERASRD